MAKRRTRARRSRRGGSRGPAIYLAGALVALGALAALVFVVLRGAGGDAGDSGAALVVPSARSHDVPHQGRVYGYPEAPVTVLEYADFQ